MKVLRVIANHLLGLWINIQDKTKSLFVDYGKFPSNPDFPDIYIKNFGKVDDQLYRGAQPLNYKVYTQLAHLGVTVVVNLRDEPDPIEQEYATMVGMKFINIPIVGGHPPTFADVDKFLAIMASINSGAAFIHCKGGRHRTGAMVAAYRFKKYGWTFDQAYAEMKQYGFYSSWGFGDIKEFVRYYYACCRLEK